ncbi:hypothetical protein LJR031_006778 [Caballeronia sp. LjRoot31]
MMWISEPAEQGCGVLRFPRELHRSLQYPYCRAHSVLPNRRIPPYHNRSQANTPFRQPCGSRVVQEALTNVTRHAEATRVCVQMRVVQDEFRLRIEDNGKGTTLDNNRGKKNFGLLGIQERGRQLHGRITFDSAPNDGFRIGICLPVDAVKANHDCH